MNTPLAKQKYKPCYAYKMHVRLIISALLLFSNLLLAGESDECVAGEACLADGAMLFHLRCALCHGNDGLGEGILPLTLGDYPNTNLLDAKHGKDKASLSKIIRQGGKLEKIKDLMPPWEDELKPVELESVTLFNELLHRDFDNALAMLRQKAKYIEPSEKMGRAIYLGRCALCHGKQGKGDGKMARIIKTPPPFDLTSSTIGYQYMKDIIRKGGEAMGRSPRMPPWGTDLTENEIDSIIIYLTKLRQQ